MGHQVHPFHKLVLIQLDHKPQPVLQLGSHHMPGLVVTAKDGARQSAQRTEDGKSDNSPAKAELLFVFLGYFLII